MKRKKTCKGNKMKAKPRIKKSPKKSWGRTDSISQPYCELNFPKKNELSESKKHLKHLKRTLSPKQWATYKAAWLIDTKSRRRIERKYENLPPVGV